MKRVFVITTAAGLTAVIVTWFLAVSWKDIVYMLDPWSVLLGEWDVVRVESRSPLEWFGGSQTVCVFPSEGVFQFESGQRGSAPGACRASGRALELDYPGLTPVRFIVQVEEYDSLLLRHVATGRYAWLKRRLRKQGEKDS